MRPTIPMMLVLLASGCAPEPPPAPAEGAYLALAPLAAALEDAILLHDAPDQVVVAADRLICGVQAVGKMPC